MEPTKTVSEPLKQENEISENNKSQKNVKITISKAFLEVLRIGCKDEKHVLENVIELLNKLEITQTSRGTQLTKKYILHRYNIIIRNVKLGLGRWKKYKLIEEKGYIQLVLR